MNTSDCTNLYCGNIVRRCSPNKVKKNVFYNPYTRKTFRVTNINGVSITSETTSYPKNVSQSPTALAKKNNPSNVQSVRKYFFGNYKGTDYNVSGEIQEKKKHESDVIDLCSPDKTAETLPSGKKKRTKS